MKIFFVYFLFIILLSSCESAKEGLTLKKRETDEFLIEKKNPLVMPPDYGNLPTPGDFKKQENDTDSEFEKIISNSKTKDTKKKIKKTNIEQSVLEKIN